MLTKFVKYEGAGNDFILIDNRDGLFEADPGRIARLCDRHFGIGADGLMTLGTDCEEGVAARMRYYNSDGSSGEMCGNGARCFTLFARHLGLCDEECLFRATDGLHHARILSADSHCARIRLRMIDVERIRTGEGWWAVNTGVPHYVEFVDDLSSTDILRRGHAICHDTERFKEGTNVNFVHIEADGHLSVRTFERGVDDETLACGTGAVAVAVITNHAFQHDTRRFRISLPGGDLHVEFQHDPTTETYREIMLQGPARRVFEGVIDDKNY